MHKAVLVIVAVVVVTLSVSRARAQDNIRVFGGYSYFRPSLTQTETCPPGLICPLVAKRATTHPNLNGWEVSATFKLIPFIAMTADFSEHNGTALGGSSAKYRTFLFGPEVRLHRRTSPFAHLLLGGAHLSTTTASISDPPFNTVPSTKDTAFALAIGGGIDIKMVPFIAFRPIQIDSLTTRFGSSTQHQPRISAGLVLSF